MSRNNLKRLYVAVATPFYDSRSGARSRINYHSLDKLISHIVGGGVGGLVVAGSTGSASALSCNQQVNLVEYVKKNFGGQIDVISADGSNITWEAIELAKRVEGEAGVTTHLSVYGYYTKPSDDAIEKHFETLANNIEGNIILYSIPSRASGITPYVTSRLAKHPKIIGIKNCPEDLEDTRRKIALTRSEDFKVFAGNDTDAVETIYAGGHGLISTAGNVVPKEIRDMVHYAARGEIDSARKTEEGLKYLFGSLFPKPVGCTKYASPNPVMCHHALNLLGFDVGNSAIQIVSGSILEKREVENALIKLGLRGVRHDNEE
jgi:4-hydroxy-tetrahydrodipicolinate synthase